MGKIRNSYRILVEKPLVRQPLEEEKDRNRKGMSSGYKSCGREEGGTSTDHVQ
jgi:hypothetical protein